LPCGPGGALLIGTDLARSVAAERLHRFLQPIGGDGTTTDRGTKQVSRGQNFSQDELENTDFIRRPALYQFQVLFTAAQLLGRSRRKIPGGRVHEVQPMASNLQVINEVMNPPIGTWPQCSDTRFGRLSKASRPAKMISKVGAKRPTKALGIQISPLRYQGCS